MAAIPDRRNDIGLNAGGEQRLQRLLGLAVRARSAILGVERVRIAAKKDQLLIAIVANDASRHSRDKVVPLLQARRVAILEGPSSATLGEAVGKEAMAVIGIADPSMAKGIRALFAAEAEAETE